MFKRNKTILRFQFLIKGYLNFFELNLWGDKNFQFLIKGYSTGALTLLNFGTFNSSLKDTSEDDLLYRYVPDAFNSSLKDTDNGVQNRVYATHFQFLIKGYQIANGINEQDEWFFQFLIKGYTNGCM